MSSGDALPARSIDSNGAGEASATPAPADEAVASASAATADPPPPDKELLCTICGLRACWQA